MTKILFVKLFFIFISLFFINYNNIAFAQENYYYKKRAIDGLRPLTGNNKQDEKIIESECRQGNSESCIGLILWERMKAGLPPLPSNEIQIQNILQSECIIGQKISCRALELIASYEKALKDSSVGMGNVKNVNVTKILQWYFSCKNSLKRVDRAIEIMELCERGDQAACEADRIIHEKLKRSNRKMEGFIKGYTKDLEIRNNIRQNDLNRSYQDWYLHSKDNENYYKKNKKPTQAEYWGKQAEEYDKYIK